MSTITKEPVTQASNTLSGMLPINKDNATLPQSLRVLHKAGGSASSVRGALLTTAGSAGNLSSDFVDGSALTANHVSGEVTDLSSLVKTWTITGSDEIVRILTVADTSGNTATTADTIYIEEMNYDATVLPIATVGADICVPASSYLGAEPLAFAEGASGHAGTYHDGTALDATRLYFKSNAGTQAVDTVDLVHTEAKFKDICEAMEDLINSTIYDEVIKVHYLTVAGANPGLGTVAAGTSGPRDGQFVHNAFASRGILIKRCLITNA